MSTLQFVAVIGLLLAGFGVLGWILWRTRGAPGVSGDVIGQVEQASGKLEATFRGAQADMAARVEQIKGDLRTDLADRVQQAFTQFQATVDRQLAQGRSEQADRLSQMLGALEQKFEALRSGTESRLEQYGDKQSAALKEARMELAQGLNTLASGLQLKFEQLSESQLAAARQARVDLGQSLAESTRALQQRFEALEAKTSQNLETIRAQVDEKLHAISEQVQSKLEKNIHEGFAHFQKVQEHLKAAEEQLRNVGVVGQSINELNNLLKLPHLRGKFGEAELGRLLADFLPASAFEEQVAIAPGSRELVDAVVKFRKKVLPIDSKFNREQILPLFETGDPEQLACAREQLASAIRQQARDIATKYIRPEHGTTEMALMFLPSETIYFEVIRNGELLASVHKLNVFPVSPNTLIIALRAIEMSINEDEFVKGIEKTLEQIRAAQANFGHFQKKFEEVGRGLEKAQEAYHTATTHLNRYANRVVRLTGDGVPEAPELPLPESSPPPLLKQD